MAWTPPRARAVFAGLWSAVAQLEPEETEGRAGSTPKLGVWLAPILDQVGNPRQMAVARGPPSSSGKQPASLRGCQPLFSSGSERFFM